MKLKDKVAVVTGGTRGIGAAIVRSFAKEGAKVLFTFNQNDILARQLVDELKSEGCFAEAYKIDVRNYDDIDAWKEGLVEKYEKIDILVNNAGIIKDKALVMMSQDDWGEVINTNLNGLFNVTRNFIFYFMKQRSGNIINISSLSGVIGLPRQINYSASKGGMIAFTKSLAKEVAGFNIRVNVVAPGFITSDMTKGLKEEFLKDALSKIPLGRFGEPGDVAKAALYLASDDSSYITGEVIKVDGGMGI